MSENIQLNLYTVQSPVIAEVIENRRITPENHPLHNDVRHIVLRPRELFPYLPGQSAGVVLPGLYPDTQKPHKPRLYSIASSSKGDFADGNTFSLCVVRHFWEDPEKGKINVPGLVSNYLCDLKKGETVRITGPVGKHFLLPEDYKKRDFIFAATGTGIAPFRGMLRDMFDSGYEGHVCLYFGAQSKNLVLYDDEFERYKEYPNFSYVTALSREEQNPIPHVAPTRENRMYVQVKMYQHQDFIKLILEKPDSIIYICGVKGMEQGIFPILEKIGSSVQRSGSFVNDLKREQRLRVEVY